MHRLTILLAVCAATACSASAGSHASEGAEHSVPQDRLDHAGLDLNGAWATGSAGEPAAARLELPLECNYSPSLWALEQRGDTVRALLIPESRAQGIHTTQPLPSVVAEGRISGVKLTMRASGARYVLRYDSTSGHLRGTLNDVPFWAVRQDLVQPHGCIAIP